MSRSFRICLTVLLLACPVFANSVKVSEARSAHPYFVSSLHLEVFSSRENRSWDTASRRASFDFDDSAREKVHFFHRSERQNCGPRQSVDPPVVAVAAVPEVPTAWLLLLGTLTLLGFDRLRVVLVRRS